jgi:hypothetical protein
LGIGNHRACIEKTWEEGWQAMMLPIELWNDGIVEYWIKKYQMDYNHVRVML